MVVFALAARWVGWVCFWHDLERSHKGGARIGSDRIGMTRQITTLSLHYICRTTRHNTTRRSIMQVGKARERGGKEKVLGAEKGYLYPL